MLAIEQTGAYGSAVVTMLNTEFDSRVLRTSLGVGGVTKPRRADTSHLPTDGTWCPHCEPPGALDKLYCLNCGKEGAGVTAELPAAMRGDPGVIWVCNDCEARQGSLPMQAISFEQRR